MTTYLMTSAAYEDQLYVVLSRANETKVYVDSKAIFENIDNPNVKYVDNIKQMKTKLLLNKVDEDITLVITQVKNIIGSNMGVVSDISTNLVEEGKYE